MPQIEVSFDIDANGILNVKAVDKGTGKEQSVKLEANSGLSDQEVERMRAEAEQNAEADKQRRELVETQNQAEQLVHQTKTQLEEHKDKLSDEDRESILAAAEELDQKRQSATDKAELDAAMQAFSQKAQKLAEILYANNGDAAQGAPGGAPEGGPQPGATAGNDGDEPVDADFEVKT